MKRRLFYVMLGLLVSVSQAQASNVGFSVGVNVGTPGAAVPVYAPQPVVIAEPPEFIYPPQLGFYVAIGLPYDLFLYGNRYYLFRGDSWYVSPYYNGPWTSIYFGNVPYGIRRHSFSRIHYYRDDYYRRYDSSGRWYDHRPFRPGRHEIGGVGHAASRPGYAVPQRSVHGNVNRPDNGNVTRPESRNRPEHGNMDKGGHGRGER